MSPLLSPTTLELPILRSMLQQADRFAQEQPTPSKAEQVYCNTLAILTVQQYLNCLDIVSDHTCSHSWNPIDRLCSSVSDLYLPEQGRLECRPVKVGQRIDHLPVDCDPDRLGYLWVELNLDTKTGQILGYLPTAQAIANAPYILLDQLMPLDQFPQYLAQCPRESSVQPTWTNLNQWLKGEFAQGWQAVEDWIQPQRSMALLFAQPESSGLKSPEVDYLDQLQSSLAKWLMATADSQVTFAYRGMSATEIPKGGFANAYPELQASVFSDLATIIETTSDEPTRWRATEMLWSLNPQHPLANTRRIRELSTQLQGQNLGLMIAALQSPDYSFSILVRLYPLAHNRSLPDNLQLEVCSIEGESFASVHSRRLDSFIQLCFNAIETEQFCIRITSQDQILHDYFQL
jgi:hypothetical protein